MRMFVFLAIGLFGVMPLGSSAAPLGEPQSHICPPADEPIVAMSVDAPAPPRGVSSPAPPVGVPPPEVEPMQMMGCLDHDYAIRAIEVADALRAAAIVEEPGSTAAIFAYADPDERDALMTRWTHGHDEKATIPAKPTRVHIAGWSNLSWSLPDRSVIHAMHPETAPSGYLCLVRADTSALRAALPVLNNWCMDILDLWG